MGNMTVAEIIGTTLDILSRGGVVAFALLILVGGHRRWWVFGWQYEAAERRAEEWRELALNGTLTAERAVSLADTVSRARVETTGAVVRARQARGKTDGD